MNSASKLNQLISKYDNATQRFTKSTFVQTCMIIKALTSVSA
jgi:hypothetical protein